MLEKNNLSVGIVTAIAGQTRARISFSGRAAHAGTTPMDLRKDALCGAAEFISFVENQANKMVGLVATVGQLEVKSGASNVVPGCVTLSLDVRHQSDSKRKSACANLKKFAQKISNKRGLQIEWDLIQETAAIPCSRRLSKLLANASVGHQPRLLELPSGAGHDAAVMASITPVAMLFVRCKGGISHHPDESVRVEDVKIAISVMNDFLQLLAKDNE